MDDTSIEDRLHKQRNITGPLTHKHFNNCNKPNFVGAFLQFEEGGPLDQGEGPLQPPAAVAGNSTFVGNILPIEPVNH